MPLFRGLTGSSHHLLSSFSWQHCCHGFECMEGSLAHSLPAREPLCHRFGLDCCLAGLLLLLHRAEELEQSSQSILMTWLIASIWFVAVFCCAMPYSLIPNLFAFDIMGAECAALIAFFELTSFCSKMPAHMLSLHMAETFGWDLVLLQMTVTMIFAALLLQALLPRWRSLQTHGRHGRVSPTLVPSSPNKLVSEIKLEIAVEHYALGKQSWVLSPSSSLAGARWFLAAKVNGWELGSWASLWKLWMLSPK